MINYIKQTDVEKLIKQCSDTGVRVYVLHGENIYDAHSFFCAINNTLPLEQAVHHSWDALADSLFEGLSAAGNRRVAVIWTATDAMIHNAGHDFQMAIDVFNQVFEELGSAGINPGRSVELQIFIADDK